MDWYQEMVQDMVHKPTIGEPLDIPEPSKAETDWYQEMTSDPTFNPAWGDDASHETLTGEFLPGPLHGPKPIDAQTPADITTSMKAGMMEDRDKKIEIYAAARFPDLPLEEAVKRYGVVNGDIVFVGDHGKLEKETGAISEFAGEQGLPIAGAIAGVPGGPVGVAVGGMGGLATRKLTAMGMGDNQTSLGNAVDVAVEGILNAVGWKAGKMISSSVDRNVVRDLSQFDKKIAEQVIQKGKELGIDLTPAEASQLGSLISQQTRLGMGFDEAGDTLRKFYLQRANQVDDAVNTFIGDTPSSTVAGAEARDAAGNIIKNAKNARKEAAKPLYDSNVNAENILPEKEMDELMADDVIREAIYDVKEKSVWGVMDDPINSVSVVDAAKKQLDDQIETAIRAGRNNEARILTEKKNKLVGFADTYYPGYKEARTIYAGKSPEVDALEDGVVGVLAKVKDPKLLKAADKFFNATDIDAQDVLNIRHQFKKSGNMKEWDNFLNSWLRKEWESIKPTLSGEDIGSGGKLAIKIFGSKRQKDVMQAAMGPQRFAAFKKLMEVLEATGRVPKTQSITQPATQAAKDEMREAAPAASMVGENLFAPVQLRQWWLDTKSRDWRSKMADVITNPDSIKELEKLRKLKNLKPSSKNAISIVTTALTKAGVYKVGDEFNVNVGAMTSQIKDKKIDSRVLQDLHTK